MPERDKHSVQKSHGAVIQPWDKIQTEVEAALKEYPVKYNGGVYNTDIIREIIDANPGKYPYTYNSYPGVIKQRISTSFRRMGWGKVSKGCLCTKWRPQ
jgi:hypothetical protein